MMKKAIFLFAVLVLMGCGHIPIEYTYKTNIRNPILTKADIMANPNIGVAILSMSGARDTYYVERGVYDFMYFKAKDTLIHELIYTNIGPEIKLDGKREISNAGTVLRKCPGMRYALCFWEGDPHISKYKFSESKTVNRNGKEEIVYYSGYRTTISIDAEITLFDLKDNLVLAKASREFKGSEDNIIDKSGPDDNPISSFLNALRVISDLSSNDSERYREIDLKAVEWEFKDYTYSFLKLISKK